MLHISDSLWATEELCSGLHTCVASLPRYRYPYNSEVLPLDGIYVLFEEGETGHDGDRVTMVASHSGLGNLASRLDEHFRVENKDRSVFRKNIGRALLCRAGDPFIQQWNWDLTSRKNKRRYEALLDVDKLRQVEAEVTAVIRRQFSFAVLPMDHGETAYGLKNRLIATVAQCSTCRPSAGWLGLHSPKRKIRDTGLWQEYHLAGDRLTYVDLALIYQIADRVSGQG